MIIKRNLIVLIIILVMSIILTGCTIFSGPPETEESVKQKVVAHLNAKGYKEITQNTVASSENRDDKNFKHLEYFFTTSSSKN